MDQGLPHLGADTLQDRATRSSQIWEARQQAREDVVEGFETVDDPERVPIRNEGRGFAPSRGFLERAEPREAAHRLDDRFERQDLGPANVRETSEGWVPTERTERTEVAREFEATTPLDQVDPFGDLTAQDGGGFGLADQPRREVAAAELDPEYPDVDLGAGDVQPADGGAFGLTPGAEREVAAERIEDQTPLGDVGAGDIRETDDGGFELRDSVIENNRGLF